MKTTREWSATDLTHAKQFDGVLSSHIEFQDNLLEWHNFEVLVTPERIVFGGYCNVGFLQSGYIEREEYESLDETLGELYSDLQAYYNDGPQFVSRIVCSERM